MSGTRLARDLLAKVLLRRRFLAMARREGRNDDVVRLAQEICELVAKAALRYLGVDPPRTHDPAALLRRYPDRLPSAWKKALDELDEEMAALTEDRAVAFYGDEEDLVPPSELFGSEDGAKAQRVADRMIRLLQSLLKRRPRAR